MIQKSDFYSWDEFRYHILQLSIDYSEKNIKYVFRGQRLSSWPLETTLTRAFRNSNACISEAAQILLSEFRHNLKLIGHTIPDTGNSVDDLRKDIQIWELGQHYGLPTPLLDWSESPYIAACFAIEELFKQSVNLSSDEILSSNEKMAIWALRWDQSLWSKPDIAYDNDKVILVDDMSDYNPRIRAQLGCLTYVPPTTSGLDTFYINHKDAIEIEVQEHALLLFTLPHHCVIDAVRDLRMMDINPRKLFPEFAGACRNSVFETHLQLKDKSR